MKCPLNEVWHNFWTNVEIPFDNVGRKSCIAFDHVSAGLQVLLFVLGAVRRSKFGLRDLFNRSFGQSPPRVSQCPLLRSVNGLSSNLERLVGHIATLSQSMSPWRAMVIPGRTKVWLRELWWSYHKCNCTKKVNLPNAQCLKVPGMRTHADAFGHWALGQLVLL